MILILVLVELVVYYSAFVQFIEFAIFFECERLTNVSKVVAFFLLYKIAC